MKLCTFQTDEPGSRPHVGLVHGGQVVAIERALPGLLSPHQPMLDLIARWDELGPAVRALQRGLDDDSAARTNTNTNTHPHGLALDRVRLLAPVPRPPKVLAIGLNYLDHVQEKIIGETRTVPQHQVWFTKLSNAINGPYDPIVLPDPAVSDMTDYEAEMVAIIGRRCKQVAPENAHEVVFGYCVGNDVSVRDWQKRTSQWTLGKSFDTHAPFGPWITTADALADPHALGLRGFVNGQLRQSSNTRWMIHDVWAQIAHLSQAMTLEPGDVIFTGTCGGVGAGMTPPSFLRAGDRVRIEIDQLGHIEATCQRAP